MSNVGGWGGNSTSSWPVNAASNQPSVQYCWKHVAPEQAVQATLPAKPAWRATMVEHWPTIQEPKR